MWLILPAAGPGVTAREAAEALGVAIDRTCYALFKLYHRGLAWRFVGKPNRYRLRTEGDTTLA